MTSGAQLLAALGWREDRYSSGTVTLTCTLCVNNPHMRATTPDWQDDPLRWQYLADHARECHPSASN